MIDVVFVRYYLGPIELKGFLRSLLRIGGRQISRVLVVDIGKTPLVSIDIDCISVIRFDSSLMDIAAYGAGVDELVGDPIEVSCDILLANDTLVTKHPWRTLLRRFFNMRCSMSVDIPCAIGVVNSTPGLIVSSDSVLASPFLSTYFVSLNPMAVRIFRDVIERLWDPEIIDQPFKAFIYIHLYSKVNRYSWRGKPELASVKSKTVLFERLLSRRIIDGDGMLIDVNGGVFELLSYRLMDKVVKLKWLN